MDYKKIQSYSQALWEEQGVFKYENGKNKEKYYVLDMFPYPSGDGLHVGHVKGFVATDIVSHYMRLKGYDVLHPMGWDAFGLPAENYAIKMKINPKDAVSQNIAKFKSQLKSLGLSYDWSREINTTEPDYYKWTQWVFLQMYKKGLAYQADVPINFCPSCKTGLANEEVVSGKCERCKTEVVKKKMNQWMLKITEYADQLLEDLDDLNWPESIKEMQRNWIGKSTGTNIKFKITDSKSVIEVFTTRVDTLFGCTYLVMSPEYSGINEILAMSQNRSEIEAYIKDASKKSDIERTDQTKEKTGVIVQGVSVINPVNKQKVDIFIADYVLGGYGTGAVMAVPAHDERDFEFANKYGIEIKYVVIPEDGSENDTSKAFIDYGVLSDSGKYSGLKSKEAINKITEDLSKEASGDFTINYKLRDWVFSRQRYWGEPIPIIHCQKCGTVPVKEEDLPVELPEVKSYEPTGTGESPLANIKDWVSVACPRCGQMAKRETDTMPQWAGSSWYYLRYIDTDNPDKLVDPEKEEASMPVDLYVGGAEHAVLHLLYARFWHKFLKDIGSASASEPFKRLLNVGIIMAPDRQKMSKSRGNVINPNEIIDKYGVDALRMYEMFIGPFEKQAMWSEGGISGTYNFIEKLITKFDDRLVEMKDFTAEISSLSLTISKKIESMNLNTIVSDFMKFTNNFDLAQFDDKSWKKFLVCLSPLCPHTCEYLWGQLGEKESIFKQSWDDGVEAINSSTKVVIQVNGKTKDVVEVQFDLAEDEVTAQAIDILSKKSIINKSDIAKVIFVKNRVINFVTK